MTPIEAPLPTSPLANAVAAARTLGAELPIDPDSSSTSATLRSHFFARSGFVVGVFVVKVELTEVFVPVLQPSFE